MACMHQVQGTVIVHTTVTQSSVEQMLRPTSAVKITRARDIVL